MSKPKSYDRYHRQLILRDFGEEAQQKLQDARVLVIGAGGLGCPALQYLAAAGVGTIGIVDDDRVALSNLHRQVLFSVDDIGHYKAGSAVAHLGKLNPELRFYSYQERLTNNNVAEIFSSFSIIVDGSDNFATRYLVNDACVLLDKVLVYGAVSQYEGQVAIFNCRTGTNKTPVNYRDLFPRPPAADEVLNCEEAGVLGVVPGIIGTMMASETIKLITGIGEPVVDKLVNYDARSNQLYEIALTTRQETGSMIPANLELLKQTDYDWFCSTGSGLEISNEFFSELMQIGNTQIIDVREKDESPSISQFEHISIPLGQLNESAINLKSETIVLFCQSGRRSLQAAIQLKKIFGDSKKVFSLKDGIVQWLHQQSETV